MPEVSHQRHSPILESAARALFRGASEPDRSERQALLHVALDVLEELERTGEAGAGLYRLRADTLFALRDYDAVAEALAAGMRANPDSGRLCAHAASLLVLEMRRLESGWRYLMRAEALDPRGRYPRPGRGTVEALLARYRAAGLTDAAYRRFGAALEGLLGDGCRHDFARAREAAERLGLAPDGVLDLLEHGFGVRCDCDALRRARGQ